LLGDLVIDRVYRPSEVSEILAQELV